MPPPDSLPGLPDDYTPQFFGNDVVTLNGTPLYKAKVLRCWLDEDGEPLPPLPPGQEAHPLDRPLKRGEVGISHLTTGHLSIVPEANVKLFQREFLKGDIVKRSLTSRESALIVDVKTEVRVQQIFDGVVLEGWVPFDRLTNSFKVDARDRVIYDNWIGTVEEVFEDGFIASRNGECYRLAEMGGLLEPGRVVQDVIPKDAFRPEGMSRPLPAFADPSKDRVLKIDPVVVYVIWNALNQTLPNPDQGKHEEPKPFWYGEDLKKLTLFDTTHTQPPSIGRSARFKTLEDEQRYGFKPPAIAKVLGLELSYVKILESRSTLLLRWQRGEQTEEPASQFVPYANVDDYESWPGEHVLWRGDNGERRHAVVQKFDPFQRVASLLFMDTKTIEVVPAMELDPGGRMGNNTYGVGIGQNVLLCPDNGAMLPEVPGLGQNETPVKNMWSRHELAKLAEEYVGNTDKFKWFDPEGQEDVVDWWGEVVDLHLDGDVSVRLANREVKKVGLKHLYALNDVPPEMLDELGPGEEDDYMDEDGAEYDERHGAWGIEAEIAEQVQAAMPGAFFDPLMSLTGGAAGLPPWNEDGGRGVSGDDVSSEASWETMSEDDTEAEVMEVDRVEEEASQQAEAEAQAQAQAVHTPFTPRPPSPSPREPSSPSPPAPAQAEAGPSSLANSTPRAPLPKQALDGDDEYWQPFEMLEQAPEDHKFYRELSSGAAGKSYISRMRKEHRTLMSSLPENILVRAYEDRLDLLRVLIVGPEGTPYTDAPFVFDVYLNPTKFPNEPPVVHFHSHTNGHGRCNPNLYEEGKVCLSVLGTWSGDESESWSPTKSSLLQVFVSISGLVLVRSPYHCEPAFAKLEGTREGKVNSRLYSEKAYVLSRSFVRTALERPPTGFGAEIRHFYLSKGRLQALIDHAQRLIEKGEVPEEEEEEETGEMWNADAMGRLTMGAIITLKRTITVLEQIWAAAQSE